MTPTRSSFFVRFRKLWLDPSTYPRTPPQFVWVSRVWVWFVVPSPESVSSGRQSVCACFVAFALSQPCTPSCALGDHSSTFWRFQSQSSAASVVLWPALASGVRIAGGKFPLWVCWAPTLRSCGRYALLSSWVWPDSCGSTYYQQSSTLRGLCFCWGLQVELFQFARWRSCRITWLS